MTAYGIRPEPCADAETGEDIAGYAAYRYEAEPAGGFYVYQMCVKRWKTLEVALLKYAAAGARCFPLAKKPAPFVLTESEVRRAEARGFGELLRQGK